MRPALLALASLPAALAEAAPDDRPQPLADAAAVVSLPGAARVSVLGDGLLRVQLGGTLDERPTYQVVNRRTPVPHFTHSAQGGTLTVKTSLASVRATAHSVDFSCSAGAGGAGGSWSWQPQRDPNTDPLQTAMPISARGMYVMDDSDTARLGGADATHVAWWQHPKTLPTPPSPLPPADTCAAPRKGVDVTAGATRSKQYRDGLANVTQAECCAACNAANGDRACSDRDCTVCDADTGRCSAWAPEHGCVAWAYAPDAKECWPFSAVAGVTNTSQNRVFGGAELWPPKPRSPPPAPTDLYLFCYGASGPDEFARGMRQLTSITGRAPLMPLAAYGVWYSGCCIPCAATSQAFTSSCCSAQRLCRD